MFGKETGPVASARIGTDGTVVVMGVHYDKDLFCDRKCSLLRVAEDGLQSCLLDRVENMSDYRIRALVVEYQCILDRGAAEADWTLGGEDFKVVDNDGFIHGGSVLCDRISYPVKTVEDQHTLYGGTRANIVIFYPDFPAGKTVSAIIVEKGYSENCRIDLDASIRGVQPVFVPREPVEDNGNGTQAPALPDYGDLRERVVRLEEAVRELQVRLAGLAGEKAAGDKASPVAPSAPVQDAGSRAKVKSVSGLLALDPAGFRDTVIRLLEGYGFKDMKEQMDPEGGYCALLATRYGSKYAIYTVQANKDVHSADVDKVEWLVRFSRRNKAEKAMYVTSGKLSSEAERLATSRGVEIMDIDRISYMLGLQRDSFGYQPLTRK
jgi:hypothetical protein